MPSDTQAEALSGSTDWGPTAGAYRDLMRRWKEAGPAPKGIDDQLWKRFRAAQDVFFGARDAANAATDAEFAANAEKKEALLAEAEALLPVTDLAAAKAAFRDIAERWDAAGKVPRDRMKELEGRIRKVEQEIRAVEEDAWRGKAVRERVVRSEVAAVREVDDGALLVGGIETTLVLREARAVSAATVVPRDFDIIDIPFEERGVPRLVKGGALPGEREETAREEVPVEVKG